MALGVDGMRAGRVVWKASLLTVGTLVFVASLTMMYESMRAVMEIGGSCASGGPYTISRPCPQGVGWIMPVSVFGMLLGSALGFLGVFSQGGPRPWVFGWSALFLALGWNFLDYGFDPPGGGTSVSWLVCGFVFVAMGGLPLLLLFRPAVARWVFWGPRSPHPDTYLRSYQPPPTPRPAPAAASTSSRPASSPSPTTDPEPDVVEQLATLADLHERGLLDTSEYEQAKTAVLRRTEAPS
jgi:hypothetical protein